MLQVHLLARTLSPGALEPGGDPIGVAAQGQKEVSLRVPAEEKGGRHLLSTFALLSTASVGPMGWNTLSVHGGHSKEQTPSPGVAFPPQTQVPGCWYRDAQQNRGRRQEARESAQCVPHTLFRPSIKLTPCAQPQPFCSPVGGVPQPVFLRKVLGTSHWIRWVLLLHSTPISPHGYKGSQALFMRRPDALVRCSPKALKPNMIVYTGGNQGPVGKGLPSQMLGLIPPHLQTRVPS